MIKFSIDFEVVGYNKNLVFTADDGKQITYSNIVLGDDTKIKCDPEVIDAIKAGNTKQVTLTNKGKLIIKGSNHGNYTAF